MKIHEALTYAISLLKDSSDTPELDAQVLLEMVTQLSREALYTRNDEISHEILMHYQQLVELRRQHVPVAYLTGQKEFWSLTLSVTADTLIPRPETETLVEYCLQKYTDEAIKVLDLGTGCGAIALALASERPRWHILATDINPECCQVAESNAERLGINNVAFQTSAWFDDLYPEQFDLIVSNPPYIANGEQAQLSAEVNYEPNRALFATENGLSEIRAITQNAKPFLKDGGLLVLEHGYQQAERVRKLLKNSEFIQVESQKDLQGLERLSAGQKQKID